jgi:hypothetical protein
MRLVFQKSVINAKGHFTPGLKDDLVLIFIVMTAGQKLNMRRLGKKMRDWLNEKPKLIKIYLSEKITRCENCGSKFALAFHHRPKRSSQKAKHDFDHTRLLCQTCHDFFEYNDRLDKKLFAKPRGYNPKLKIDIMKKEKKNSKADWQKPHKCKHCRKIISMLVCPHCKQPSI